MPAFAKVMEGRERRGEDWELRWKLLRYNNMQPYEGGLKGNARSGRGKE